VDPEQRERQQERATREQQLADLEHETEERMHSVADLLPDGKAFHQRADRISGRARARQRRADDLREE
jgi:hypothetical protein